jgi:polysaccharide export outer membrane protein
MFRLCKKIIERAAFVSLRDFMLYLGLLGILTTLGCVQNKVSHHAPVWESKGGLSTSGEYRGVVLSDIDNDGNMDIIGGGASPGAVAIWYGDGSGEMFQPQFLSLKGDVRSISVADFDEDGLKDIVFSVQRESSGIMVWKNHVGRKWLRWIGPIERNNYEGVDTADINGDGHMDIVAANATSDTQGGIQVWLGNGKGAWPVESGVTVAGVFMDVALADFNQDGFLDLAGAGWGIYGVLSVWIGDGTGGWSSAIEVSKGSYYGLNVGDVDGDGNMDIFAGSYREGVQIFQGDGKGEFVMASSPEKAGSFWQVLPVDLDGDGRMDLLASSLDSEGVKAWRRSEGPNAWVPILGRFPSTGSYYGLAIGDFNTDGRNDIFAASIGEGIKFFPGQGALARSPEAVMAKQVTVSDDTNNFDIKENSTFTTVSGFPEYKIGIGDILEITLWKGISGVKEQVIVRADGKVSFGLVDDLYVNGLTCSDLDDLLTEKLKEYIKTPRVDVLVKEHKSKFVTMLGAGSARYDKAGKGKYPLSGKVTILEMLSDAGGLHRDANLANISLRRKDGESLKLDLYNSLLRGGTRQDVVLDDGDVIYIPLISKQENRVYVYGEVGKPGVYSFEGSGMRLLDAISEAGGVTVFAYEKSTKIVRGDISRPEVISADVKTLLEQGDQAQNLMLANGDLVYVPRSFVGDVNRFVKQITPLLQLILAPAKIIKDYDDAYHIITE